MAGCTCFSKPLIIICWIFHAIVSATFLGLAVTTGNNLKPVTFNWGGTSSDSTYSTAYKNSLMAAVVLGFIVTFFFLILSPIVLLGKCFGKNMKLSYGIMLGLCLNSAWTLLLAGLVLNTSGTVAKQLYDSSYWSASAYSAYQATFAFAYILTGTFIIMFIVLLLGRGSLYRDDDYAEKGPGASGASGTNAAAAGGNGAQMATLPPSVMARFGGSNV